MVGAGKAEKFSQEYLSYLGNIQTIISAIQLFTGIEGRFPGTFEEVLKSPYLAVAPENLLNPYTGKKMRVVKEASPGDIGFVATEDKIIIQTFYKQTKNGKVESSTIELNEQNKQFFIQQALTGNMVSDPLEYVKSLSLEDKITYFVCQQLSQVAYKATLNPYFSGDVQSYAGLKKDPQLFNWRVRNPYTGGIAKEVTVPSPGDFFYKVFKRGGLYYPLFICYNREKKAVSPGMAGALETLQRGETSSAMPTEKIQTAGEGKKGVFKQMFFGGRDTRS